MLVTMKRISRLEKKYVNKVLESEFRSTKKTNMVRDAEEAFSRLNQIAFSVGFTNGTSTLHTALEVLNIGPGDEVIVPPLTMAATTMAVLHTGATPVFADVDPETFQISASSIKECISKNTKCIITVALYGGSPDYDSITKLAPDIPIIEDNAEALLTKYKGIPIGGYGVMSSYSFQSSKHLSAGEGGMLCTNSEEIADKIRKLQCLGYASLGARVQKVEKNVLQNPNYERHVSLGWNYRMSELTGAVVLGQIERSRDLLAARISAGREIFDLVQSSDIAKTQKLHAGSTHSFWAAPIVLVDNDVTWEKFRDKFIDFGGKGIYAAWKLTYDEPFWKNSRFQGREKRVDAKRLLSNSCPNAEYLQKRILSFRTNEWSAIGKKRQLKALEKTLSYFQ